MPLPVYGLHATHHAFGGDHGDAAYAAFAKMLFNLDDNVQRVRDVEALADDAKRLINWRHLGLVELHINSRAAD